MATDKPRIISAEHPAHGWLFAAFDPSARFVEGKVAHSRLGAVLAPFPSEEEARAALDAVKGGEA